MEEYQRERRMREAISPANKKSDCGEQPLKCKPEEKQVKTPEPSFETALRYSQANYRWYCWFDA